MPKQLFTIFSFFILLFSLSSSSYPYTPGSVQVTVMDFYSEALLSGATVTMEPGGYSDTTDLTGVVTFTGITPYRNYAVAVSLDGYVEGSHGEGRTGVVGVATGQTTSVTIPIKKKSTIQGQVTSSSVPVPYAVIVLTRTPIIPSEDEEEFVAGVQADASGNYIFPSVADGSYFIRAFADSYLVSSRDAITIASDDLVTKDFSLTSGTTSLSYNITTWWNHYGANAGFGIDIPPGQFNERYMVVTDAPPGAEILDISLYGFMFTPTLGGNYTVVSVVTDLNDVVKEVSKTEEMVNDPTDAFPSIIPGPSVLPLLYDGLVYADSRGTVGVRPGEKVCFRGWGSEQNLNAPKQFNPDAPMFDIYGNKNGDWSQSAFSFEWSLRDGPGVDQTALLNSTSTQNVCFTVPAGAQNGDVYIATVTVTGDDDYGAGPYAGDPVDISVVVAGFAGNGSCGACHSDTNTTYVDTTHNITGVDCEDCHGPGSEHVATTDTSKISTSHWPGVCGQCHDEFAQWQKSRHSDPLAFGHAEISIALIRNCYKCHYTDGFIGVIESGEDFSTFEYPLGTNPPKDTPNISCDICHDPHVQSVSNPVGIRTVSGESLCVTCHEEQWQNAVYTATGDVIENAYHWGDYSQYQGSGNPHKMAEGCVTCHMAQDVTDTDAYGVRKVGGHSLRMRDVGADGDPGTSDDLLNIPVCNNQGCHVSPPLENFDSNGFTTNIKAKLDTLGDLLRTRNNDFLPPFQPGKCATCHRGSTLPFIDATASQTLENAYLNYKLVLHDRSLGIHNPGYAERLLDDTIAEVEATFDPDEDGIDYPDDNCPTYPNGPLQGTCTKLNDVTGNFNVRTGQFCSSDSNCAPDEYCEMSQADNYPAGGNGIGDACDCEGNFNCDENVDGGDVGAFLTHFGRSIYSNPCSNAIPCNGDFSCDTDVDGGDVEKFLEDFARSTYSNPCPLCDGSAWCTYP